MPTVTDSGKQGPHPDVFSSFVDRVNEHALSRDAGEVRETDIHMLQQRTLYGIRWSTGLWEENLPHDGDIDVDVSAGLALATPQGSRKHLAMYLAYRLPDKDWDLSRWSSIWLDDPPKKPWSGFNLLSRGLGIGWGMLTHSPEIGKGRIALADGRAAESIVSNNSFLMFVPFNSAELWSSVVTYGFYDTAGREILTESLPLDLSSLTRGR